MPCRQRPLSLARQQHRVGRVGVEREGVIGLGDHLLRQAKLDWCVEVVSTPAG